MKIGIIGAGGAGLTAAWLLEKEHDVVLFERHSNVGGHANTVDVERDGHMHHVDDGFSWFSDKMYPRYLRLLSHLGVETIKVPMTASFTDVARGQSVFMPPVSPSAILGVAFSGYALRNLLAFNKAVNAAAPIVSNKETGITCRQYLDELRVSQRFKDEFLSPFMSAVWGCPWERTLDSSIYPLMKYIVLHKPVAFSYFIWHVVKGGANAYARTLQSALETTSVRTDAHVSSIEKTEAGYRLLDRNTVFEFDQLIFATGAFDAQRLLSTVVGLDRAKSAINQFEYYQARVATHSDPRFMPPNRKHWAVSNIRYDGQSSDLTIWHGRYSGSDVFASYIQDELPAETHHVSQFNLPLETPAHFEAQKALLAVQGHENLWFAGDYTQDIGSHEDAVCSAVLIAETLAPDSDRLNLLKGNP